MATRMRRAGRARAAQDGFTLLEVLVAMAILGVGIVAVMQFFPPALRQSRVGMERTRAAAIADSKLSQLRTLSNPQDFKQWVTANAAMVINQTQQSYEMYQGWHTSVQQVSEDSSLYRVTFSVQMLDGRYETFVTYVTRGQ